MVESPLYLLLSLFSLPPPLTLSFCVQISYCFHNNYISSNPPNSTHLSFMITETSCVAQSPTHLTLSHMHTLLVPPTWNQPVHIAERELCYKNRSRQNQKQIMTESWHGGIYVSEWRLPLCRQPIQMLLSAALSNYADLGYHCVINSK